MRSGSSTLAAAYLHYPAVVRLVICISFSSSSEKPVYGTFAIIMPPRFCFLHLPLTLLDSLNFILCFHSSHQMLNPLDMQTQFLLVLTLLSDYLPAADSGLARNSTLHWLVLCYLISPEYTFYK